MLSQNPLTRRFRSMRFAIRLLLSLANWKIIDILIWLFRHISVSFGSILCCCLISACATAPMELPNGCIVDAHAYYIASHSAERLAHLTRNEILIYSRADGTSHAAHVWEYQGNRWFRDASGSRMIVTLYWEPLALARAAEPGIKITHAYFLSRNLWEPPQDYQI